MASESMSEVHSCVSSEILNHKRPPSETSELINSLGRDLSIKCLLHCSPSDYGSIACLNQSFRSLIKSGDLYKLRRKMGITEPWIYFLNNVQLWFAYNPYRSRWITLPDFSFDIFLHCCVDDPFDISLQFCVDEPLVVGTELLVFVRDGTINIMIRYNILTNSWSIGNDMNFPRSFFGSASFHEKAIIAGGTDLFGNTLNSVELYNSELQTWETLPSMNKRRMSCSGVFMDGKFYMLGGRIANYSFNTTEVLTCGEEYDPVRREWRVIPNMSSGLDGDDGAPPHVAVLNNELYATNGASNKVMKYDKMKNSWITLGELPVSPSSVRSLRIELCACGESLIVISGYTLVFNTECLICGKECGEECEEECDPVRRECGECDLVRREYNIVRREWNIIELYSWIPNEGKPEWNMIVKKRIKNRFVNCAVMSY